MQSTRISLSLLALQLLNSVHFYSVHLIDSHCHYNKVRIITSPPSIHPRNIFLSGTDPIYTTSTCLSMLFVYNPTAIILLDPRTEIKQDENHIYPAPVGRGGYSREPRRPDTNTPTCTDNSVHYLFT